MPKWDCLKLHDFLSLHPRMRLTHYDDSEVIIEGDYEIQAQAEGFNKIHETYHLKIIFSQEYPKKIPTVFETQSRIPRSPEYHTYENGSFCLGSDIKLKIIILDHQSISEFFNLIIDPFLYSVAYKINHHVYPLGELAHGEAGLVDDYENLFGVQGKLSVLRVVEALGKRKREANKIPCPCGCGDRLGRCGFRFTLEKWRQLEKRRWFRAYLVEAFVPIEKPKKRRKKSKIRKH